MSIATVDLLRLSEKLQAEDSEASWRGAISRGYYAAFHHADAWHDELPSKGIPPVKSGGRHHDLANCLIAPTLQSDDPRRGESIKAGYILRDAHKYRVKADYFLDEDITAANASMVIVSVKKVLAMLG